MNLYNVPIQGNHTAVEVLVDGQWAFYDPTFGAYFTAEGDVEGPILSLEDVASGHSVDSLESLVNQASGDRQNVAFAILGALFSERFEHPSMSLNYYQMAESISRLEPGEFVILDIPIFLTDAGTATVGDMTAADRAAGEAAWLAATNQPTNQPSAVGRRSGKRYFLCQQSPVEQSQCTAHNNDHCQCRRWRAV